MNAAFHAAAVHRHRQPALNIPIFGSSSSSRSASSSGRRAATRRPPTSTPAAGRSPARRTAPAIAGDYLSAASFLGIAGAIAVNGYDGFLYSIGFLVAWLVALLLVAELLRNTGKFTMADVLSFRLRQRPVRMAAAIADPGRVASSTCWPRWPAPAALVALLLGVEGTRRPGRSSIAVVGVLMIVYVAGRRHEGHHLGADHQGRAADRRRGRS